jgi:hypothetical protein
MDVEQEPDALLNDDEPGRGAELVGKGVTAPDGRQV